MDVTVPYKELQTFYNKHFSLSFLGKDISNKFALISLTCYLVHKLKEKNPDVSHWSILYKLSQQAGNSIPEEWLKGLAIMCEDFGYGCTNFPTFNLKDREIPEKIKEILKEWLPF